MTCAQRIGLDVMVRLRDLRDVWMARDLGFDSVIVGEMLLKACARDSMEPATVIKAMLAKGSVEFGGGAGKVVSGGGSAYGPSLPKFMPTFSPSTSSEQSSKAYSKSVAR